MLITSGDCFFGRFRSGLGGFKCFGSFRGGFAREFTCFGGLIGYRFLSFAILGFAGLLVSFGGSLFGGVGCFFERFIGSVASLLSFFRTASERFFGCFSGSFCRLL